MFFVRRVELNTNMSPIEGGVFWPPYGLLSTYWNAPSFSTRWNVTPDTFFDAPAALASATTHRLTAAASVAASTNFSFTRDPLGSTFDAPDPSGCRGAFELPQTDQSTRPNGHVWGQPWPCLAWTRPRSDD